MFTQSKRVSLLFASLMLLVFVAGCAQRRFEAIYQAYSYEDRVQQADLIVAGTVKSVSNTHWNKDDGTYWEKPSEDGSTLYVALPIYTVEVEISQTFVSAEPLDKTVTLTVLGNSPLDENASHDGFKALAGSEVVVFARYTDLDWDDGSRPIVQLLGLPTESYLLKGSDGLYRLSQTDLASAGISLSDLEAQIADLRR